MENDYRTILRILIPVLLAASFLSVTAAENDETGKYPFITLSPQPPASNETLTLSVFLGVAGNSCTAPTYSSKEFSVKEITGNTMPPVYAISVSYTEIIDNNKICTKQFDPVEYGPTFDLGRLNAGTYIVYDSADSIGEFSLAGETIDAGFTLSGVLGDDPYPEKRQSMPIGSATVYLKSTSQTISAPATGLVNSAGIWNPPEVIIDSTTTGSDGSFFFTNLSRGTYIIESHHSNYNTNSVTIPLSKDTSIQVTLLSTEAHATINGTVKKIQFSADSLTAIPFAGCSIFVFPEPDQAYLIPLGGQTQAAGTASYSSHTYKTVTNSEGFYTVSGISLRENFSSWYVLTKVPGYNEERQTVVLANQMTQTVDFSLQAHFMNTVSKHVEDLRISLSTNKVFYGNDDGIQARYSLTNQGTDTITLEGFSGNCEYDYWIFYEEDTIYQFSDNTLCTRAISDLVIPPGKTVQKLFPRYYIRSEKFVEDATKAYEKKWNLTARLRGADYAYTAITIPIEIAITPLQTNNARNKRTAAHTLVANGAQYNVNRQQLTVSLGSDQKVQVKSFTLQGQMLPHSFFEEYLRAGTHHINLKNKTASMTVIHVRGQNWSQSIVSKGTLKTTP